MGPTLRTRLSTSVLIVFAMFCFVLAVLVRFTIQHRFARSSDDATDVVVKGQIGNGVCDDYAKWTTSKQFTGFKEVTTPIVAVACRKGEGWRYIEGTAFVIETSTLLRNGTFYGSLSITNPEIFGGESCDVSNRTIVATIDVYYSPFLVGSTGQDTAKLGDSLKFNVVPGQNVGSVQEALTFTFINAKGKYIRDMEVYFPTWFPGPDPYVDETDASGNIVISCANTPWLQTGMPIYAEYSGEFVEKPCQHEEMATEGFNVQLNDKGGSCAPK